MIEQMRKVVAEAREPIKEWRLSYSEALVLAEEVRVMQMNPAATAIDWVGSMKDGNVRLFDIPVVLT